MVTSQVFRNIMSLNHEKKILMGNEGISKTVSVRLFWILSRYFNEYRFHTKENKIETVGFSIPKIVYWPLKTTDNYKNVRELILNQCPELDSIREQKSFLIVGDEFKKHY